MSKFAKSHMTVDGNTVHMSMPFAKVDEAKRLVSGFATLDNIDSQDDVVTAEASAKAFARARGNIREMHQPLAVGRMVDFREDEFYDPTADGGKGAFYRGIFVTARVSEGAEDTWKKVLDGTLTGFSIGGEINEATNEFVKDANGGKKVRFIKDYDLVELSLVDNPANQLANVKSIQKNIFSISHSDNGDSVMKGMVADTVIENVFVCPVDTTVLVKNTESETCPECGTKMDNAGWFESGTDRTEKVHDIVTKFLNPSEMEAAPISPSEGGVEMGNKDNVTKAAEEVTVAPAEETETAEVETEETTEEEAEAVDETAGTDPEEETESPKEVADEEEEVLKKIDELHAAVKDSLEKTKTETAEQIADLKVAVEKATEEFKTKASELESKMDGFGTKLEASKSRLAELESRLEKVNSGDALRKSVDLEESPTDNTVQKGTSWNGAFSGKSSNGFSVDNL